MMRKIFRGKCNLPPVLKLEKYIGDPVVVQKQRIFPAVIIPIDGHKSRPGKIYFIQLQNLALSPVNLPYPGKPFQLPRIRHIIIAALQINLSGGIKKSILIKVKILLRPRALGNGLRENVQLAVSPEAFKLPVVPDVLGIGALPLKKQADQADSRAVSIFRKNRATAGLNQ